MRGMRSLTAAVEKYRIRLRSEQQMSRDLQPRIDLHICVRSQLSSTFDIMFAAIDPAGKTGRGSGGRGGRERASLLLHDRAFVVFAIIAVLDSGPSLPRSVSLNCISMEFLGDAPINLLSG